MTSGFKADIQHMLATCPTRRMERRLVRCLPQLDFKRKKPSEYLYTSGRPGRCNASGVSCLYFSETEATANAEYRSLWRGTQAEHQPNLTYFSRVTLARIIDLKDARVMRHLGLRTDDFDVNWRMAKEPTLLQRIGRGIASQQSISALRYPSAAARRQSLRGWNVVIYRSALLSPDRVEILSDSKYPLEVLPD